VFEQESDSSKKNIRPASGLKNFGTGAESKSEKLIPGTSAMQQRCSDSDFLGPVSSENSDLRNFWLHTRDDRIVDFHYPILTCFRKMISVSEPNPVLVEIILSVSENYPIVYCDAQHIFCAVPIWPC